MHQRQVRIVAFPLVFARLGNAVLAAGFTDFGPSIDHSEDANNLIPAGKVMIATDSCCESAISAPLAL